MIDMTSVVLAVGVVAIVAFLIGFFTNGYLATKNDGKIPFKEDI